MSKAWAAGSTRQWRRVRAAVLADNQLPVHRGGNNGRCTLAIANVCEGQANTVHHILGRSISGDDRRYLQATCRACNLHVGQPNTYEPKPKILSRWTP